MRRVGQQVHIRHRVLHTYRAAIRAVTLNISYVALGASFSRP